MDLIYNLVENDSRFDYFRGIDLKKNINLQDEKGYTLAMLIAKTQKKDPEITLKMIKLCKKQDMNLQNKYGNTLAMLIVIYQKENPEISLKMLKLCKDQDMNLQNVNGYTLDMLIFFYQTKNPEITLKMLKLCKDKFIIERKLPDEERKLYLSL